MRCRNSIGVTALAAALMIMIGGAAAFDETKYPTKKDQAPPDLRHFKQYNR